MDSIGQYFQKDDVVVEKRKLTEKEREEREAAYVLNVRVGGITDR